MRRIRRKLEKAIRANRNYSLSHRQLPLTLETLESRVLLSADLPGLQLVDSQVDHFGGQSVYLDFDGADNVSYNGPVTIDGINVPAFSVASAEWAGREDAVIADVTENLNYLFANTGVDFTAEEPEGNNPYSTIYIGGYDSAFSEYGSFLGVAEKIDDGNQDSSDNAFVFTEFLTANYTEGAAMATALTGVIAHEAGHLLGYEHNQEIAKANILSSVAAFADFYSDYRGSPWGAVYRNYETIVSTGTYTFEVDGIATHRETEWYVNGNYQQGENDSSGSFGWDPQYDVYCGSGTTTVSAIVYYVSSGKWNHVETHNWYVTRDTTPPSVPSLLSPSNGNEDDDRTVYLDWSNASDSSGIDYYQVIVDNNSNFSSPEFSATPSSSNDTTSSLADGKYYWKVRAKDNAGIWGSWPSTRWFRVDDTNPSTPTLKSPSNNSTTHDQTPYFDWYDSSDYGSGIDYYEFECWDGDISWGDISTTTSSSNYTPSSNIPFDTVYWKVRAVDDAGNKSSWSSNRTLHITGIPDLDVLSVTDTKTSYFVGDYLNAKTTIRNIGTKTAKNNTVYYYLGKGTDNTYLPDPIAEGSIAGINGVCSFNCVNGVNDSWQIKILP